MKLLCKIGTQGLSDGRRIKYGETYEVDDVTAFTLVAAGCAKPVDEVVEVVQAAPEAEFVEEVVESVDIIEPAPDAADATAAESEDITNDPVSETADATDAESVADDAMKMAESVVDEPAPDLPKKRTYKRRK